MLRISLISLVTLVALAAGYWALSGSHDSGRTAHKQHAGQSNHASTPKEVGQANFAAIAEIVGMLVADPKTDWSTVNITVLRDHLMDMEALTTGARVTADETTNGSVFTVTGDPRTIEAAQTMVVAHSEVLNQTTSWKVKTQTTATGVTLVVEAVSAEERQKIHALGFFGIMATGAHHQKHHYAMATGASVHAH